MARRWGTEKWVYDPKARRTELKASAKIRGAHDHLYRTCTFENYGMDMDPASFDAVEILSAAAKRVMAACKAAQDKAMPVRLHPNWGR